MATRPAASRLFVLSLVLLFLISIQFGSADQSNVTAEPGQDVILPCEAARNKDELTVDWSKPDLGENDHVALYRDDRFDNVGQNPTYKNRVDLQDRKKNRNVSLVLKNVTINDTGKYECRVLPRGSDRRKRSYLKNEPICNVTLDVSAPGNKEGHKDGGNEEGKKDGGNEEGKKDGGNEEGKKDEGTNTGVIVGVLVPVVVALLIGGFLFYIKHRRSPQEQNQPPAAEAELQAMNVENHPEPEM